ncbi:MAG: hypothetical protein HYY17_06170 [Planctomycetes bacterium]|nr:hypothetical protein [Planctomycetota bacterium]
MGKLGLAAIIAVAALSADPASAGAQNALGSASAIDEVLGTATTWEWKTPADIAKTSRVITILRGGGQVKIQVLIDETFKPNLTALLTLAQAFPPVETQEHLCRETPDTPKAGIKFVGEAFERIVPPDAVLPPNATPAQNIQPLLSKRAGGNYTLIFAKATVQQASGRFYVNGEAHQVLREYKIVLKKANGAKFTYTPTARKKYMTKEGEVIPTALPRFDGKRIYAGQFRVFHEVGKQKVHVAVVAADMPGALLRSETKKLSETIAERLEGDDELEIDARFATYFFEDQEASGTASLLTHRMDWKMRVEIKIGSPSFSLDTKGKSIFDTDTKIAADPSKGDGTPYAGAEKNDPGKDDGWDASTGQFDVVKQ